VNQTEMVSPATPAPTAGAIWLAVKSVCAPDCTPENAVTLAAGNVPALSLPDWSTVLTRSEYEVDGTSPGSTQLAAALGAPATSAITELLPLKSQLAPVQRWTRTLLKSASLGFIQESARDCSAGEMASAETSPGGVVSLVLPVVKLLEKAAPSGAPEASRALSDTASA